MKLSKELYRGEVLVSFVVAVVQIVHESERANLTTNIIIGSNKMLLYNKYENLNLFILYNIEQK